MQQFSPDNHGIAMFFLSSDDRRLCRPPGDQLLRRSPIGLRRMSAGWVAALLCSGIPATNAHAQIPESILECARVTEPDERLRCYDSVVAAAATADSGEEFFLELTGEDDGDSEPIEVDRPWYVEWRSGGSIITVELQTRSGDTVTILGTEIGRGSGRSILLDPGEYRIAVRGVGRWEIRAARP